MEEAIKKITDEMEKDKANTPVQLLGKLVLQHLKINPGAAPAIMSQGKTLAGAMSAMREEARKHHNHGGVAALTDEEGLNMALNYFGVVAAGGATALRTADAEPAIAKRNGFSVYLDDLLEDM